MRKSLNLVSAVIVYALVAVGCLEDNPSKINEQSALQSGESLIGTKWKLVGFYDNDINTKIFKEAEPKDCKECYILEFDTDSTVTGYSTSNPTFGWYKIDYSLLILKFIQFHCVSEVGEIGDGNLYVEVINKVNSFSFAEKELKLFYNDKKNYLLFIRRQ